MRAARSVALAVLCAAHARGDILQSLFPNTALAAPANVSTVPNININSTSPLPDYVSVRFDGMITASDGDFANFTVISDGVIRLWVDDHLLIEDENVTITRTMTGLFSIPFVGNSTTRTLRLEYIHWTGPATLQLLWAGNATAQQLVPASAMTDYVSPTAQQRQAMRDRLYAPPLPWQTAYNPSMMTQVHMPSGFALVMTLADASRNSMVLGDVIVYRGDDPARVIVGPHSYSSDIMEVTVESWSSFNCSVMLQSSMIGVDLVYVATSTGPDCSQLLLLVQPQMLWSRAGNITYASSSNDTVTASLPGFPTVTTFAATGTATFDSSAVYLALPLAAAGDIAGIAALSTGSNYSVAQMQATIATARAAQIARAAAYGNLSMVYDAMQSVIAWNTVYIPDEGVFTTVSRGWNLGDGYVAFEWDTFFVSYMGAMEGGTARDIAYSNAIQMMLARTLDGFVPNFAAGLRKSYDRSESQIGAFVIREIYNKTKDAWLVETVFDTLLSWNAWVWRRRRGEGILAPPGDFADLMVLGSDPGDPMGDWSTNRLQGARYEGLDNSPMYDAPPVEFNTTTHHMNLYDIGATALYLSDTAALLDLAVAINRSDVIPQLQVQFNAVQTAMNANMWDDAAGIYSNVLYNGSFYSRYAPSSFFPLLSNSCSDAQADALAAWLASPQGFCVNATDPGPNGTYILYQWLEPRWKDNAACGSDACKIYSVLNKYGFVEPELRVLQAPQAGVTTLPLNLYVSPSGHDLALTTEAPANYSFVRTEGYCLVDAPVPPAGIAVTNVSLWYSDTASEYKTCGTAACIAAAVNYTFVANLCYAYDASTTSSWGCQYGVPSIARGDTAFVDNNYWRGRIWGPHMTLVYWGLRAYDHVPSVHAARQVLVAQGKALVEQDWAWFRHVNENMNGWIGTGSDSGNADPFYHWGALPGFLSLVEAGFY